MAIGKNNQQCARTRSVSRAGGRMYKEVFRGDKVAVKKFFENGAGFHRTIEVVHTVLPQVIHILRDVDHHHEVVVEFTTFREFPGKASYTWLVEGHRVGYATGKKWY